MTGYLKKIVVVIILSLAASFLVFFSYIFQDGMVLNFWLNKKTLVKLTNNMRNIDGLSYICLYENDTKYIEIRFNQKYRLYTNNEEKINKTREISNLVDKKKYDNKYYNLDSINLDKEILEKLFSSMRRADTYCAMRRESFFEVYINKGALDRYYGYVLFNDNYQKSNLKKIFLEEYRYASLRDVAQDLSIHNIQKKWFWFTYSE